MTVPLTAGAHAGSNSRLRRVSHSSDGAGRDAGKGPPMEPYGGAHAHGVPDAR